MAHAKKQNEPERANQEDESSPFMSFLKYAGMGLLAGK